MSIIESEPAIVAPPLHAVPDAIPWRRPLPRGLVGRPRLVRRLADAPDAGVAVVVAPAGYGKTTLLRQWEETDPRPFEWVDAADAAHLDAPSSPSVRVLDDLHLHGPGTLRDVARLVGRPVPGCLLVLASRTAPRLAVGRLRAEGALVELGTDELAMTELEAGQVLRQAGLVAGPDVVATLTRRAEGWPAGLVLAARSLRDERDIGAAAARFAGDDRLVADYLREEVLSHLSLEELDFVVLTSPLGDLSGPLCDAVLERQGSGRVLCDLARSDLLLAPLDPCDERFRYHPLLADMLRSELRRAEPEHELEVHRRASVWHEQQGDDDQALEHAIAAGQLDRAGELMWALAGAHVGAALAAPIERWLTGFRDEHIAARATLALTAATAGVLGGRRDAAERWTGAGERMLAGAGREAEPSLRAGAAILRAMIARDDVARMADDAARGYALAPHDSPWRAVACLLAGIAHHLMDDRARAHDELEEGLRRAEPGGPAVQATCLAQLALLRLEADDWEQGAALALQAGELAAPVGADGARRGVLAFAVSAFACAHRGDVDRARRDALEGRRRLALPGQFPPWYEAETRIALARAELRLSNAAGARTLLAEASRALHRSPQAVVLRSWIDDAWERADTFAVGAVCGPTTLTTAELRVLRFLPSHLSFREVAARLHVSANTVKTQAHAVYRKLDASSRSEAVARARDVGLVDG